MVEPPHPSSAAPEARDLLAPTQDDAMCTDQAGGCMGRVAVSGTREAAMEITIERAKGDRERDRPAGSGELPAVLPGEAEA